MEKETFYCPLCGKDREEECEGCRIEFPEIHVIPEEINKERWEYEKNIGV